MAALGGMADFFQRFKLSTMQLPSVGFNDIIDILVVATLIYNVIAWIKDTRAWTLFKGILILLGVTFVSYFLHLSTLLWIFSNTISVGIIAVMIVFQPELRRALDELGRGQLFTKLFDFADDEQRKQQYDQKTIQNIITAVTELSKTKTGVLIAIERETKLTDWDRTGIHLDAEVSSQLLINIFEHNTPLHDGAVIVRDNRISSATCYLPLTESLSLSKELGTRHRAAIGLSEVSDAIVVVVSEETGTISIAKEGNLTRNLTPELLRKLLTLTNKGKEVKKKFVLWKGRR